MQVFMSPICAQGATGQSGSKVPGQHHRKISFGWLDDLSAHRPGAPDCSHGWPNSLQKHCMRNTQINEANTEHISTEAPIYTAGPNSLRKHCMRNTQINEANTEHISTEASTYTPVRCADCYIPSPTVRQLRKSQGSSNECCQKSSLGRPLRVKHRAAVLNHQSRCLRYQVH